MNEPAVARRSAPTERFYTQRFRWSVLKPALHSLAFAAVLGASGVAAAQHVSTPAGAIHPSVLQAVHRVHDAKGPAAYAALRDLWRTWDRADPSHVEEAIIAIANAPELSPPIKTYAELLAAYARRRRGDLDGSTARIERLGFVNRWIAIGPFDNENKEGLSRVYAPELELLEPLVAGRAYDGKERPVRWRAPPVSPQYGWFDFGTLFRPLENVCAYATTFVRPKPDSQMPRPISLWVGSSGAFKLFFDDQKVLEDTAYRDFDVDRLAATVTLGSGFHRITIKVCGDERPPTFSLRIGNEKGAPEHGVEVMADLHASADAAQLAKKHQPTTPKPVVEGPLQALERAALEPKAAPAALYDYAKYLTVTGGDPKAAHTARDLARRAAEAQPTIERLLLAGQLAEDRNQQREWLERAASLVQPQNSNIDVLLARALHARTGPNWRDAVPIYERILKLDPDNVSATLGLVELYIEAGLTRTALHILEQASSRQPNSVALLGALARQLRALGRDTEASEVESRYAALRFDDADFLSQQVNLAVARHDALGAARWLERFLRVESDSAWSRAIAARTYRSLGQRDRAIAVYQRALSMAPEDISALRAMSDLYGETGDRDRQLDLLHQILAISPQSKEVREYIEHIEPPRPRADEAFAWAPERFLPMRTAQTQRYPKRTLRNLTVTTVYPNGLASRFRQVVFQPLTDEAAAQARQFSFGFEADRQTVTLRGAKVYRADGKKIDEAIESGEAAIHDPAISMYTSQRAFVVQFPRLNIGDLVEIRYRIEDVALRNELSDYFGELEYLQTDEPIANSEYILITPKERSFHVYASPLPALTRETKEDRGQRIFRFSAQNVPPVAPEPAMPPWDEVRAHVHVSTFATWDLVGSWYWGLVREQFDVDDEIRKKTLEITRGLNDDASKVRAIYKFAAETRYVALEFGIEGIRPRRAAQTLARGWGDCKDKATLIVTMLREVGIPATIVLVRTRLRGEIEQSPASLAPFDHAIAYVPSLDLYLDGTAENTGSHELPIMDRGTIALQINEGKPKLVRLPQPPAEQSVARRKVDLTLASEGSAQISVEIQMTGAFAPEWRRRYLAEGTRHERVARDLAPDFGPVEIQTGKSGVEVNNLEDIEQPVKIHARGKARSFGRREGDRLSIPIGGPQGMVSDYASLSDRHLDLLLSALTSREDEWIIRLPPGMTVTALPSSQQADTPFGKYSITVEQSPAKITVRSSLALKKARIRVAEYPAWRQFCEAVDRAFGQRLVVRR